SMTSSIEYVRAGQLRALAVTTSTHSPVLPDTPTVAEFVPGYEASFWTGIGAPRNTPIEIVEKLNQETNAALADSQIKARLAGFAPTRITGLPRRLRKAHRRGNREVGKGGEVRGHQAAVKEARGNSPADRLARELKAWRLRLSGEPNVAGR